jgi:hypothetical protein
MIAAVRVRHAVEAGQTHTWVGLNPAYRIGPALQVLRTGAERGQQSNQNRAFEKSASHYDCSFSLRTSRKIVSPFGRVSRTHLIFGPKSLLDKRSVVSPSEIALRNFKGDHDREHGCQRHGGDLKVARHA